MPSTRTAQGLTGWSDPTMAARYQHLIKQVRTNVADRLGALLWELPDEDDRPSAAD